MTLFAHSDKSAGILYPCMPHLYAIKSLLIWFWQLEKDAGENISKMRVSAHQSHLVATGGKENDLKVWDLNDTENPIFAAKNVSSVS